MKTQKFFAVALIAFVLTLSAGAAQATDIALTSVGQSPDATMVRVVLKSLKVEPEFSPLMKAADLKDEKVLIAVVGGSSKGLGAAGINQDDEAARVQSLLEKAKADGKKILVMHVGGEGRRGTLTDLFIRAAAPFATAMIVVDGGNADGIFTQAGESAKADILTAPNVKGTKDPLQTVLSGWGVL